jgi:transporter family-2 protein
MDRGPALAVTLLVGALIAFQPPANAALARQVGDLGSAFVSLAVSTLLIGALLVVFGEPGQLRGLSGVRPEHGMGALGGAAVVFVTIAAVRPLGAAGVAAALVATQLSVSALIDRFGVLGVDRVALSPTRLLGVVLLVVGTVLVTSR